MEKYTKEMLQPIVKESLSVAEVLRRLDLRQSGGSQANITKKIRLYELDTSHFTGQGWTKGMTSYNRKKPEEVLVLRDKDSCKEEASRLRRCLIEIGVPYQCSECSLPPEWNNKPLTLHVDHIDGCFWNNRRENLRFLCPNCHGQTETWGRNKSR